MMRKILGKRILFVTAHPDDESYLAAGTILKNARAGGKSFVACATFGEKGKSHVKGHVTAALLKEMRKNELLAVSKFLNVTDLLMPGLPDTKLAQKRWKDAFSKKLMAFSLKHRPDLIISFGNDGISGHTDHIAAGEVARKVAEEINTPFLTFSAPPSLQKSLDTMKKRRKHGKYIQTLEHQPYDFEIPVDPKVKLKALLFHKSQFDTLDPFADLPPETVKEFLTREYFSFRRRL